MEIVADGIVRDCTIHWLAKEAKTDTTAVFFAEHGLAGEDKIIIRDVNFIALHSREAYAMEEKANWEQNVRQLQEKENKLEGIVDDRGYQVQLLNERV